MNSQNVDKLIQNCYNFNNINSALLIEDLFQLMNVADQKSLNAIYNVLTSHPCELVRHEAAFTLGEVASEEAAQKLRESYSVDPSLVVKHECLMSLGTIGDKSDIEFIFPETQNPKFEIQCSAKIAIDRIKQQHEFSADDNFETLKNLVLDDTNTSQNDRIQILFQLMNMKTSQAKQLVFEVLKKDKCRIVRHEAAFVLGEIGDQESIQYLKTILETEKTPIVVHETLFALGTTGNRDLIPFLRKFENSTEYVISESAKIAIDRIQLIKSPYSGLKYFSEK